ncbi:MAG: hypothetical protein Q7K25_07910 [Actinomycetota bacterium]|nr:hypothetical protein [Actinomycetota bacterium]
MYLLAEVADEEAMKSVIDKAGPLALLFVVLLGIALFFLFRSMKRQLKRVDEHFPDDPPGADGIASPE